MAKKHRVDASQIGARLRTDEQKRQDRVARGLQQGALKGMPLVVAETPRDTGRLANQWDVEFLPNGADLFNDAPHAGIAEAGSRPHMPPVEPILRWVVRNFGLNLEGPKARQEAENNGGDPDKAERSAMQGARRSLPGDDPEEASSEAQGMAWAIALSIAENGTEPNWMVRDNLKRLKEIARNEVEDELSKGP